MRKIARIFASGLLGALTCAILSSTMFALMALHDGARVDEAIAYIAIIGLVGAFVGAAIGGIIGIGNLGVVGGGIVGVLAILIAVAIYVLAFGRPEEYDYFLRESGVFLVVWTLPMILTGIITAFLGKARRRT